MAKWRQTVWRCTPARSAAALSVVRAGPIVPCRSTAAAVILLVPVAGRAQDQSPEDAGSGGRGPRANLSMGVGMGMEADFLMTYSVPRSEQVDVEVGLLFARDSWESVGRETRCSGLLGCFTGNYVTDQGSQSSLAAIARWLNYGSGGRPGRRSALAFGAGPALLSSGGTHLGLVVDGPRRGARRAAVVDRVDRFPPHPGVRGGVHSRGVVSTRGCGHRSTTRDRQPPLRTVTPLTHPGFPTSGTISSSSKP